MVKYGVSTKGAMYIDMPVLSYRHIAVYTYIWLYVLAYEVRCAVIDSLSIILHTDCLGSDL